MRSARSLSSLRQLDHPNVMPLLDASEGGDWFVMPLATGNLYDLWKTGNASVDAERLSVQVVRDAGEGLSAAHELRHVHRDVSPGNILRRRFELAERGA